MSEVYRVIGVESSPYTVKVRAVLRYRRIPHQWLCRFPQMLEETAHVRPSIMPVVQFPDGTYWTDSTPILYELEKRHPGRSILPGDEGLAFLCHLIEDMADEWLAKCLFYFRFSNDADSHFAARWVMSDAKPASDTRTLAADVAAFRERQISRRPLVGATAENAEVLEESYQRVLAALEPMVGNDRYLFGSRPSLADFGLYAQLKALATDPTPASVLRERAPFTEHWVRRLDDSSGVDGSWAPSDAGWSAVPSLLRIAGDFYLPFLKANDQAIEAGEADVTAHLASMEYRQPVFPYQQRCFRVLRKEFETLQSGARSKLRSLLEETGCWKCLAEI